MIPRVVQVAPPTGAALRSNFKLVQEAGAEMDHAAKRAVDNGQPYHEPNLWATAKARAEDMIQAGEAVAPRPFA